MRCGAGVVPALDTTIWGRALGPGQLVKPLGDLLAEHQPSADFITGASRRCRKGLRHLATGRRRHVFSDVAIPPGEALGEEIEARGMTQRELAVRLDRLPQVVNEIICGEKAITPDIAIAIGKAMGGVHGFWANLEADYRLALAWLANLCRFI